MPPRLFHILINICRPRLIPLEGDLNVTAHPPMLTARLRSGVLSVFVIGIAVGLVACSGGPGAMSQSGPQQEPLTFGSLDRSPSTARGFRPEPPQVNPVKTAELNPSVAATARPEALSSNALSDERTPVSNPADMPPATPSPSHTSSSTPVPTTPDPPVEGEGGQDPTETPFSQPSDSVTNVVLSSDVTLLGYWSDGTASIAVDLSPTNLRRPGSDDLPFLSVTCFEGIWGTAPCPSEITFLLGEAPKQAITNATVRLSMGRDYTLKFEFGDDEEQIVTFNVPERILAVDWKVWECFRDVFLMKSLTLVVQDGSPQ